LNFATKSV